MMVNEADVQQQHSTAHRKKTKTDKMPATRSVSWFLIVFLIVYLFIVHYYRTSNGEVAGSTQARALLCNNLRQVVHTLVRLYEAVNLVPV